MATSRIMAWVLVGLAALLSGPIMALALADTEEGGLVQFGKMHEAIGRQQHQGRVALAKLAERPHFYGVAALAELEGEATFVDGALTITVVDGEGTPQPVDATATDKQATLLIGAYVPAWTDHPVTRSVAPDEFDQYLADVAAAAGVDTSKPFMFTIEGKFSPLRLHVINGACPMHARLQKIDLPTERRPFEADWDEIQGTVVGVFARNSVGNLTHPATSAHMHLVYRDAGTAALLTGHVERTGLLAGSTIRLPKSR